MRNAITVRAVMAFLLVAAARAEEPHEFATYWGNATDCRPEESGQKLASENSEDRLLAAFAETGNYQTWVRVLQRGEKYFVETTTFDAWHRHHDKRRRSIDQSLVAQVSTRLADDLARDALVQGSDEIAVDGISYLYTPDGKNCAWVPGSWRNAQAQIWAEVFFALSETSSRREADAWFWLDQAAHLPATLPTSLAGVTLKQDAIGAASVWNHAGTAPMAIVSHRAGTGYPDGIAVYGELANNLGTAREWPHVVATFCDANGTVVATEEGHADFSRLPSGAKTPFWVRTQATNAASYTLRIAAGDGVWLRPPSVRVTRQDSRIVDDEFIVRGAVRNTGKQAEDDIEVYVLLYDEAGRLLDDEQESLDEPLRPGASTPFEVSIIDVPSGYHHYEVVVNPEYREQPDPRP